MLLAVRAVACQRSPGPGRNSQYLDRNLKFKTRSTARVIPHVTKVSAESGSESTSNWTGIAVVPTFVFPKPPTLTTSRRPLQQQFVLLTSLATIQGSAWISASYCSTSHGQARQAAVVARWVAAKLWVPVIKPEHAMLDD
jgi:hypothetical protein